MSVAEAPPPDSEFERTPPHDVMAEQCVLGGMMLSKDAIAEVVEALRAVDFYRPAHQVIYDTIIDLYSRGEPADAVTVSAELTKRGELARVGGAPYLHTLISSVPTAANAGYYARIVEERAVLRRLVEVGTRIAQIGYAGDGDIDDIVDRAQAEVFAVAEKRTGEDYLQLNDIMPGALDEIEAIASRDGGMTGVPTGFADLDSLTNGLHPGQMIIIAARPAVGKALALDTPLPTPHGWTTMGEVRVGDHLLAADGTPTAVVAATEVLTGRPCYRMTFADGTSVVADAEHQWLTHTLRAGTAVRTTRQIADDSRPPGLGTGHTVRVAAPLELPEAELPVPPYVLGVWLGAGRPGSELLAVDDPEIAVRIESDGYRLAPAGTPGRFALRAPGGGPAAPALRAAGVYERPGLPDRYLRASAEQRRRLLAGLLDAAGTVTPSGAVAFAAAPRELAEGCRDLVTGLGYRVEPGPAGQPVAFTPADPVFGTEARRLEHKRRGGGFRAGAAARAVIRVEPVPSVPVRCVQIDHPSHLYLATRSMVPTHNSTLALDLARAASIKNGLTSVIFSLEMGRNEITMRLLSAEARVPLHTMRSGMMSDDDWTRLARRMGEVAEAPLFIDDSPNMSMMEIRAKCRRLKQQHDLKLVVVDYLQLMSSPRRVESRQQEVSEMSRALKLLAKELNVPVIALSQLNRGPEQRTDKKPQISDLRESGSIEQDADMVILLYREDVFEKESPRAGEADLIVAKHRNGPTATVTVAFQGHYSRFVDMAN
ncbi:replicative DNA helicase [Allonocardiopsis opalescens]|uniref:Replicative DNA helicase n=1 Tax=Allonocardiopsis opalescens TaxID=1144618 RepID=A0A2T0Q6T5_9ACTN|nr:replicative DNA helicase [Allonocardiopsis opalescens]PRX99537.1 replicative DNA helicase [Allonocardiopsis opalescens]